MTWWQWLLAFLVAGNVIMALLVWWAIRAMGPVDPPLPVARSRRRDRVVRASRRARKRGSG